eukprot:1776609-Amphidinium_carterae.1
MQQMLLGESNYWHCTTEAKACPSEPIWQGRSGSITSNSVLGRLWGIRVRGPLKVEWDKHVLHVSKAWQYGPRSFGWALLCHNSIHEGLTEAASLLFRAYLEQLQCRYVAKQLFTASVSAPQGRICAIGEGWLLKSPCCIRTAVEAATEEHLQPFGRSAKNSDKARVNGVPLSRNDHFAFVAVQP